MTKFNLVISTVVSLPSSTSAVFKVCFISSKNPSSTLLLFIITVLLAAFVFPVFVTSYPKFSNKLDIFDIFFILSVAFKSSIFMSSLSILEVPVELISFSDDILFISSFVVEFDVVFVSFASSMLYNIDLGNSSSYL